MHAPVPSRWPKTWAAMAFIGVAILIAWSRIDADTAPEKTVEIWDAYYLQKAKVGYGQTTIRPVIQSGRKLVEIDSFNRLAVTRFGDRNEQTLKMSTLETPDGQVFRFTTEIAFGPSPLQITGRVEGQRMVIETRSKGSKQSASIPWSEDVRGFRAVEQSLEQDPLKPGETRAMKMLMPVLNQVADVELTAGEVENTPLLAGKAKLLRIESVARLADGKTAIASTLWTDPLGQTIKTRVEAMQQESFRTTRQLAIADDPNGVGFDLGTDVTVKLDKPLAKPHGTRQVRYRVELANADPAKVFASGPTQTIRSLGPHTAELTVTSLRPGGVSRGSAAVPADKEYSVANSLLQIDDPRIKAMAREAKGNIKGTAELALALERYVYHTIGKKNFTQAFASAAEVAESREGDCTEHAVLLAALARACQIPSRVAIGLVYVEGSQGFGYHMWTELYLDGQWIPFDATLGQGGIGAAHLKLSDSSLEGAAAYSSFLPVAQVVGQLKLSVLAAE